MATIKTPTQNGKSLAWTVREEDLEDLEALKRDLIDKATAAQGDGRLFIASQFTQLVAIISPEIKRIRDRFDRELLSSIRKEQRELKIQAREAERVAKETVGE
ncbi:MAG TPA: hypothetical protein VFV38_19245 [Ktedonobacteraceae bacterium]|nr:hypothetical protein [Ktedonobacteraceae bacterium]